MVGGSNSDKEELFNRKKPRAGPGEPGGPPADVWPDEGMNGVVIDAPCLGRIVAFGISEK